MRQGQSEFEEERTSRHVFEPYKRNQTDRWQIDEDADDGEVPSGYQSGYLEQGSTRYYHDKFEQGEKLVPQQPYPKSRRRQRWLVLPALKSKRPLYILFCLIVCVILIVYTLSSFNFGSLSALHPTPQAATTIYKVGAAPKLIIHDESSQLYIHTGSAKESNAVSIAATNTQTMKSNMVNNTINVTDSAQAGTIDITVPQRVDVQIVADGGYVSIAGMNGTLNMSVQDAPVTISESTLLPSSQVKTVSGSIAVNATFDPQGTYLFSSIGGDITVVTSLDAAVQFMPSTLVGTIDDQTQAHPAPQGQQAKVQLQTLTGSISIASK